MHFDLKYMYRRIYIYMRKEETHVIQSTRRIAIRHNLQCRLQTLRQTGPELLFGKFHVGQTEVAQAHLSECRDQSDVEVPAGVRAKGQKDLDGAVVMAHSQGDGELWVIEGDLRALAGDGEAGTGEFCESIIIGAAGGWLDEFEVSGGEGEEVGQREEVGLEMHVCVCCMRSWVQLASLGVWVLFFNLRLSV